LGKLGRPHTGRTPRCVRTAADHALAVAVAAESEVCADGVVASDSAVVVICAAESAADDLINAAAVAAEAAVGIVAVVAEYAAVEAVAVGGRKRVVAIIRCSVPCESTDMGMIWIWPTSPCV